MTRSWGRGREDSINIPDTEARRARPEGPNSRRTPANQAGINQNLRWVAE
jgi:hypothetical protein